MTLTFTVYGVPLPKGNMKAFVPRGMKFPIVTESNRNVKSWSQLVAQGASDALRAAQPRLAHVEQLTGPVRVTAAFYLPRPKKFGKRGVPAAHCKAPDVDKLLRAVLDALSRVVFDDDSQVVEIFAMKRYADVSTPPHVTVTVSETSGVQDVEVPPIPMPLFEVQA